MTVDLTVLPRADGRPSQMPDRPGGPDHPMRRMTEAVATRPESWDAETRNHVAGFFDELAAEWHTRDGPDRNAPLIDALARGVPGSLDGPVGEIGSGTGLATGVVAARFTATLAFELSGEMLRRAPRSPGHRVRADGSTLPVADGALAAVILVNMFLFGAECARVLSPGGVVVWVNSRGPETPIHLPAEAVLETLPGAWSGVASEAGAGTWCVARRLPPIPELRI